MAKRLGTHTWGPREGRTGGAPCACGSNPAAVPGAQDASAIDVTDGASSVSRTGQRIPRAVTCGPKGKVSSGGGERALGARRQAAHVETHTPPWPREGLAASDATLRHVSTDARAVRTPHLVVHFV